jgi:hypothetical protein
MGNVLDKAIIEQFISTVNREATKNCIKWDQFDFRIISLDSFIIEICYKEHIKCDNPIVRIEYMNTSIEDLNKEPWTKYMDSIACDFLTKIVKDQYNTNKKYITYNDLPIKEFTCGTTY